MRKERHRTGFLAAACALFLLGGCANDAIFPQTPLPPAPEGPQPAFPSFNAPDMGTDEERQVLTNLERQELEARLSKLAQDRQNRMQRRIQQAK